MFSDEAMLALSDTAARRLGDESVPLVVSLLFVCVVGWRSRLARTVATTFAVRYLLRLPGDPVLASAVVVWSAAVHLPDSLTVATYAVASHLSGEIVERARGAELAAVVAAAAAAYVLLANTRGVAESAFRVGKLVLIKLAVAEAVGVGLAVIFHPFVWLAVGIASLYVTESLAGIKELALVDAVLHASASAAVRAAVDVPLLGRPQLLLLLAAAYGALSVAPRSPAADIARSLTLYLIVVNFPAQTELVLVLLVFSM